MINIIYMPCFYFFAKCLQKNEQLPKSSFHNPVGNMRQRLQNFFQKKSIYLTAINRALTISWTSHWKYQGSILNGRFFCGRRNYSEKFVIKAYDVIVIHDYKHLRSAPSMNQIHAIVNSINQLKFSDF
jgi:hypothetical protein